VRLPAQGSGEHLRRDVMQVHALLDGSDESRRRPASGLTAVR
jgi:hypothetical protein